MNALLAEIDRAPALTPTLWWLGHAGFAVKYHGMIFYIDPCLDTPAVIPHADLVLTTHDRPLHLHAPTLLPLLAASHRAKLVLPQSAAERAHALGIDYHRMTTTASGLRVEFFKDGDYVRIYAVHSAPDRLGYLLRFGAFTLYHAGDGLPCDGLADRLRPFNVTAALLPIGEANFTAAQAADLAAQIQAPWLVPMCHRDSAPFLNHMLFHRPEQRFKLFNYGDGWSVPDDATAAGAN